jgi:predicted CXXCH cytochrome family protein
MRFRILRWIRTHATTGRRQYREIIVQARRLSIGRASDQHLQIADPSVFPNHAVIRAGRGRREGPLVIEALSPSGVRVNGRVLLLRDLAAGDEITIGPAIITVEPLERGAPVTLRYRLQEQQDGGSRLDRLHVLSLNESGLSKKFWSLVLASGVAAIFLLVPMSAALYQPLRPLLRASAMIPNDGLWTPGALHSSHQFIGADCNTCHIAPFTRVDNAQCAACHTSVQHHVKATSQDSALFDQKRCGDCHVEHGGQRALVSRDERLCADCHGDLERLKPTTQLANATDFGTDHPEFRLTVQAQTGVSDSEWRAVRLNVLPGVQPVERSHLSFSHKQHLEPRGIKGPKGDEVMKCEDCHLPDSSGRYMLPVRMEGQCSRCHSLRFDEHDPATTVPHGDLEGVYRTLISHFSRMFLQGTVAPASRSGPVQRRPGASAVLSRDDQRRGWEWAENQALSAARDLFEKRVCVDCHTVRKVAGAESYMQWKVQPVHLTASWMPRANFDHASHKTSRCITCHVDADRSEHSTDILMPKIAQCRTCHSGPADTDKLPSDCLMCHQFHLPGQGLFDASATSRGASLPPTPAQRRVEESTRLGAGQ